MAYKPEERAAILSAVRIARKQKFKWNEVLPLAKERGFRGGLAALQVLVSKGQKRGPKGTATASASNGHGLSKIDDIIQREVAKRLDAAISEAIAALESARI